MPTLAIEGSQIGIALLIVLFLAISVLMVLVVLIQRPQGGGLSGAFGASSEGAGQTAFGAKVGDALTTATIMIFVLFLLTAVGLNLLIRPPADRPPGITADNTAGEPAPADAAPAPAPGETGAQTPTTGDNTPAQPESTPESAPATNGPGDQPAGEPANTGTPAADPQH